MKEVADAGKPPIVIPIVVVAVHVHVALVVIPAVEGENLYGAPPMPPPLEESPQG